MPDLIAFGICDSRRFLLGDSSLFSPVGVYSFYLFVGNYISPVEGLEEIHVNKISGKKLQSKVWVFHPPISFTTPPTTPPLLALLLTPSILPYLYTVSISAELNEIPSDRG